VASSLSLVASVAAFHCCFFSVCIIPCYFIVKNKLMMMMPRDQGHTVMKRAAGVDMQIDMTA